MLNTPAPFHAPVTIITAPVTAGTPVVFTRGLRRAEVVSPATKAALTVLMEMWPRAIDVDELCGIALDRDQYPEIWFKGGSEVGVLDLTYRVRTADGRTLVTSVMLSNPAAPLPDATVNPEAQALIRGALAMAAR